MTQLRLDTAEPAMDGSRSKGETLQFTVNGFRMIFYGVFYYTLNYGVVRNRS